MAAERKHPDLSAIFRPTEPDRAAETPAPAPPPAPGKDRIVPVGVGLKESELAELDTVAAGLGLKRNALMRWALRWFLAEHRSGRVTVPVEHVTTARLQD